jgi:SAM-dependent methyltransferase
MIDAAQRELGDRADYAVADAEELSFPDGSFDAVIANHMLYHVRNRSRAFAEIRRVLVSGGTLHASTIGRGYLAELVALAPFLNAGRYAETFGLETGPGQLRLFFNDVSAERFDDGLAVTHPEPLLAYIRSSEAYNGEDLTDARATVEEGIARDGSFFVSKPLGVVSGRRA